MKTRSMGALLAMILLLALTVGVVSAGKQIPIPGVTTLGNPYMNSNESTAWTGHPSQWENYVSSGPGGCSYPSTWGNVNGAVELDYGELVWQDVYPPAGKYTVNAFVGGSYIRVKMKMKVFSGDQVVDYSEAIMETGPNYCAGFPVFLTTQVNVAEGQRVRVFVQNIAGAPAQVDAVIEW